MSHSKEECVFIIECYFEFKSYKRVDYKFHLKFSSTDVSNKSTIICLINQFHDTGSVHDLSLLTTSILDEVSQRLTHSLRKYLGKLSSQVGLSTITIFRATKRLNLHVYHISFIYELLQTNWKMFTVLSLVS